MTDATQLLDSIEQGDPTAAEQLLPLVYGEPRKLAAARLANELPGQTLQATALVHEAYLKLVGGESPGSWDSRDHFFAAAAEAMRRILVDKAREKRALKRGGGKLQRVDFDDAVTIQQEPDRCDQLLALDIALDRLQQQDAIKADLVKLWLHTWFEENGGYGMTELTKFENGTYSGKTRSVSGDGEITTGDFQIIIKDDNHFTLKVTEGGQAVTSEWTRSEEKTSLAYSYLKDLDAFTGTWEGTTVLSEEASDSDKLGDIGGKSVTVIETCSWAPGKAASVGSGLHY